MPATGYTTRAMAEDLRGLMDTLGIEQAHLIGHSLGADVALHFALLYPERINRIVAIEAGLAALVHLRKREDWPGWAEWARGLERYGGVQVPREHWHDVDYMLRASLKVPVIFGMARGLPRKEDHLLRLLDTTTIVQDYENMDGLTVEHLAQIEQPVLLLYGADSHYIGTHDVLRAALPNSTSGLLEGCEHFAPLQQPEELNRYIEPFLEQAQAPVAAPLVG
jgi:pimeloyl-ACP methyl ester carboxylesterase